MAGAKPCLGYPSRTEAVLALRRQGLLTREIAAKVGIERKTVTALEASAERHRESTRAPSATGSIRMSKISDHFDLEVLVRLRPSAAAREMSVDRLIKRIVETVAADDMAEAVLDDRGEEGRV